MSVFARWVAWLAISRVWSSLLFELQPLVPAEWRRSRLRLDALVYSGRSTSYAFRLRFCSVVLHSVELPDLTKPKYKTQHENMAWQNVNQVKIWTQNLEEWTVLLYSNWSYTGTWRPWLCWTHNINKGTKGLGQIVRKASDLTNDQNNGDHSFIMFLTVA